MRGVVTCRNYPLQVGIIELFFCRDSGLLEQGSCNRQLIATAEERRSQLNGIKLFLTIGLNLVSYSDWR